MSSYVPEIGSLLHEKFANLFWVFKSEGITEQFSVFQDFTSSGVSKKIIVITDDLLFCLVSRELERTGTLLITINDRRCQPEQCFIGKSSYLSDVLSKAGMDLEWKELEVDIGKLDRYLDSFIQAFIFYLENNSAGYVYEEMINALK
ncbi:hypothetical protein ACJJIX_00020 [Microbulbifer sp. VAAC004]|uniref:hypothetical protein n=1 Tax=unclassified Microbulbifer TaxID=2619833 RepID=UPI0040397DE7